MLERKREPNMVQEISDCLTSAWHRRDETLFEHALGRVIASDIAVADALKLIGGWREAIAELEDFCHESVRLKNMMAALDQIDAWKELALASRGQLPLEAEHDRADESP